MQQKKLKPIITLFYCLLLLQIGKAQRFECGGGLHLIRLDADESITYIFGDPVKRKTAQAQLTVGYSHTLVEAKKWDFNILSGVNYTYGEFSNYQKSSFGIPILLNLERKITNQHSLSIAAGASAVILFTNSERIDYIKPNFSLDYTFNRNTFRISAMPFNHDWQSFFNTSFTRKTLSINYLKKFGKIKN